MPFSMELDTCTAAIQSVSIAFENQPVRDSLNNSTPTEVAGHWFSNSGISRASSKNLVYFSALKDFLYPWQAARVKVVVA